VFYSEGLLESKWLEYYAQFLNSVGTKTSSSASNKLRFNAEHWNEKIGFWDSGFAGSIVLD